MENTNVVNNYLGNILASAKSLILKHQLQATRLEKKYKQLVTISLILTSTSSFFITISEYVPSAVSTYIIILSTSFMYLATISTTVIKFGNFEKLSLSHRESANKYYQICQSIAVQLTLDQTEDDIFVTDISSKMQKIFENAPTLPELMINKKDFKQHCILLDNFIDSESSSNHKIQISQKNN